jgi:hypothetical protein
MTVYLLHCFACDDTRYVTPTRTFCGCERSSARIQDGAIVLVGPGRVFEAGRDHVDIDVVRPSVIAM